MDLDAKEMNLNTYVPCIPKFPPINPHYATLLVFVEEYRLVPRVDDGSTSYGMHVFHTLDKSAVNDIIQVHRRNLCTPLLLVDE